MAEYAAGRFSFREVTVNGQNPQAGGILPPHGIRNLQKDSPRLVRRPLPAAIHAAEMTYSRRLSSWDCISGYAESMGFSREPPNFLAL